MRKLIVSVFIFSLAIFSLGAVTSTAALAGEGQLKTIMLEVDGMTCKLCPITIKKALRKVEGVKKVSAKYEGGGEGWAKITYDSSLVDVDDLTFATEEAGYSSRLKKQI